MKLFPFKASYPNMDLIAAPDTFFNTVSKEFIQYKDAGFFSELSGKGIYIYRIVGSRTYTGIIASNEITDIEDGKILGHENTIAEKEQTMMSLMLMRKAMIKPVLLAYEDNEGIHSFINDFIKHRTPLYQISMLNGTEMHIVWDVNNNDDIASVQKLFTNNVDKAYIADGHHRASITSRLVRKNYLHDHDDDTHPGLLCAFFPFSELTIFDFSRIVKFNAKMSDITLMAGLSQYFEIKKEHHFVKPVRNHSLTLFLQNECFELIWKKENLTTSNKSQVLLDVDLFNQLILQDLFGIADVRMAQEVTYVEGTTKLNVLASSAKNPGIAIFNFYPISKEDVKNISEAGDVLPPKSTWFEPRMQNGLLIKEF